MVVYTWVTSFLPTFYDPKLFQTGNTDYNVIHRMPETLLW